MDSALIYAFQVKWTRYTTFYRAWHPTFGAIQWQRLNVWLVFSYSVHWNSCSNVVTLCGFESRRDRQVSSLFNYISQPAGVPSQMPRPNNKLYQWQPLCFIYLISSDSKNCIKLMRPIDIQCNLVGKKERLIASRSSFSSRHLQRVDFLTQRLPSWISATSRSYCIKRVPTMTRMILRICEERIIPTALTSYSLIINSRTYRTCKGNGCTQPTIFLCSSKSNRPNLRSHLKKFGI